LHAVRSASVLVALLFAFGGAAAASAQDLNAHALAWARGDYRAPLVCRVGGEHRRVLRRLLIRPKPERDGRPANQLLLFDLEPPPDATCTEESGGEAPNVRGRLEVALDAPSRVDVARHDFDLALRRDGGFDFAIQSGVLEIAPVGAGAPARRVDFRGGVARLRRIERGSDAGRRLAEFADRRLLSLELASPRGERLSFEMFQLEAR
jgi:hypothetical protein